MNDRLPSFSKLKEDMQTCRLCLEAGYHIFPRAIFSGDINARIMLIGQAPGITEKEAGRPFNAGSGTRLFRWLAEAGLDETWFRETQYMTAVTKCYPGRAKNGSGDRVPSRVEQNLCRSYLMAEFLLVNPELVIPVGRLAINLYYAKSLSLKEIIGSQKQVEGRWVVPLPHPSGASRWHQSEDNQNLISQAVQRISDHGSRMFPKIVK